jgi:DME family drug/metabolite transporter
LTRSAPNRDALRGTLLVGAAAALWATFGLFAKRLYTDGFTPAELASVRAFVAFVVVFPCALLMRAPLRLPPRSTVFLVTFGVVGFAAFEVVYLAAIEAAPVTLAAALLYTAPAFVVIIARFTLGEAVNASRLAALALVLLGVLLVTGAARALTGGAAMLSTRGVVLGLAAGLSYAIYTVLSKAAMKLTSPLPALVWSFGAATLVLMLFVPPFEPQSLFPALADRNRHRTHADPLCAIPACAPLHGSWCREHDRIDRADHRSALGGNAAGRKATPRARSGNPVHRGGGHNH